MVKNIDNKLVKIGLMNTKNVMFEDQHLCDCACALVYGPDANEGLLDFTLHSKF